MREPWPVELAKNTFLKLFARAPVEDCTNCKPKLALSDPVELRKYRPSK